MRAGAVIALAAALLFGCVGSALAQQRILRGKIVSSETHKPLENAAIRGAGMASGACTAADGSFELSLPPEVTWLELAVPGWSGGIPLAADAEEVTLELDPQVIPLAPLLVAARREHREEGSSRGELRPAESGAMDMRSALEGRVVGGQVLVSSGVAGNGFRLVLRGLSSITGSNEPLVIVDGIVMGNPRDFSGTRGFGDPGSTGGLQDLNPDDIERIEILRGPAAAARYGSFAAHGVVLVTTKHGRPMPRQADEGPLLRCAGWH